MRASQWLALSLACLVTVPAAARASVVIHGLSHGTEGVATLSTSTTADGTRLLQVSNIGSSGQDGVSISLASTNSMHVHFAGPAPSPALSALRVVPHTIIRGLPFSLPVSNCVRSGNGVLLSLDASPSTTGTIEVWNGPTLVCSKPVQAQFSAFIDSYVNLCDDRSAFVLDGTRSHDDGVVTGFLWSGIQLPSPVTITIQGASFTGDQVGFRCSLPDSVPIALTDARLVFVSGTVGAASRVTIDAERCAVDPPSKAGVPRPSACAVSGVSGVSLAASSAGAFDVGSDGSGEQRVLSLNGLPPGEPWLGLNGLPPGEPVIGTLSAALSPPGAGAGSIPSCTWSSRCMWDPMDGTPATISAMNVMWSSSSPGVWTTSLWNDDPYVEDLTRVYSGGTVLTISGSSFFTCGVPPVRVATRCDDGTCRVSYVTGGVPITIEGSSFACDSAVVVASRSPGEALGVVDVRVSQSAASPPLTVLACAAVPASQGVHAGGRGVFARGPRQTVSLDGTYGSRRLPVRNLGSSGQDGIDVPLDGNASVTLRFLAPLPGDVRFRPRRILLMRYDCDDGSCAATTSLGWQPAAVAHALSVDVHAPDASSSALWLEAAGHYEPIAVGDVDGDGRPDLVSASSSDPVVASVSWRAYSNNCEKWVIDTQAPVVVRTGPGTSVTTSEMTVWRNRGFFQTGDFPTQPQFVRLVGVPPAGTAPDGSSGVCDIAIDEPGVHVAACVADGHGATIGGWPVAETWGTVTGRCEPADEDCNGTDLGIESFETAYGADPPTISAASSILRRGYLLTAGVPVQSSPGDYSDLEFVIDGMQGGAGGLLWSAEMATAGKDSIKVHIRESPTLVRLRVMSGGAVQATYDGVTALECSALPSLIVGGGDLDGDGVPDLRCNGFPKNSVITINGSNFACDELRFSLPGTAVTGATDARVMVHKLHRGDRLNGVRLAAVPMPGTVAGVDPQGIAAVTFAVAAPAPNPFLGATTLRFALGQPGRVRARVLDLLGREVVRLADGRFEAGEHALVWNGRVGSGAQAAPGVYFVRLDRDGIESQAVRITYLH